MKALLPMVATAALVLGGCSSEAGDLTAPQGSTPVFSTGSCAGSANQPGNQPCNGQQGGGGGGGGGGGNHNNNSNNPPATSP
jgi:hypothetical protein